MSALKQMCPLPGRARARALEYALAIKVAGSQPLSLDRSLSPTRATTLSRALSLSLSLQRAQASERLKVIWLLSAKGVEIRRRLRRYGGNGIVTTCRVPVTPTEHRLRRCRSPPSAPKVRLSSCMLNLSCCSILLPPVEYGSSPKYLTLKCFTEYIDRSTFYPLYGFEDVAVNVKIEKKALEPGAPGSPPRCGTCLSLINSSSLIEKVHSFNWAGIASMDLAHLATTEHWDPAFRSLATSVRDVRAFGFENGLAKILLMNLVNLVRRLLCATHDMRLTVYV